jgi:hypothetical protein
MTDETRLEILHDHYKETFGRVRETERARDRMFIWVIVLFGLLGVQVGYPAQFASSLEQISIAGGELNLGALPLAALLSATWALTLALTLRYCQTAVHVERQYPYVHVLEEQISPLVGGGDLYRREGSLYLSDYPILLNVAWIAYVVLFPLAGTVASIVYLAWEWTELDYPVVHQVFDTVLGVSVVGCFFITRVIPKIMLTWRSRRDGVSGSSPSICLD